MATTRLRKAFRYPEEGDAADAPEGMDEIEQENLIDKLAQEDATRSKQYTRIFLILPLLSLPLYYLPTPFTPSLHHPPSSPLSPLHLLLATLSLLSSAFILLFLPSTAAPASRAAPTSRAAALHALAGRPLPAALAPPSPPATFGSLLRATGFDIFFDQPAATTASVAAVAPYVPYVGGCAAVLLYGIWFVTRGPGGGGGTGGGTASGGSEAFWSAALPAVVFGLTLFVRAQLRPVDVEGLRRLQYPYKGA